MIRLAHIGVMKFAVHIVMVLAILTVGISPACAFISGAANGQSAGGIVTIGDVTYIEICRGLDVVRIALDENGNEIEGSEERISHDQAISEMCGFCFAQTMMKADLLPVPNVSAPGMIATGLGAFVSEQAAFKAHFSIANASRAPPKHS